MAVVLVKEQGHLRTGTIEYATLGESNRVFYVHTDSGLDDDGVVFAVAGNPSPGPDTIPPIGDSHPTRGGIYVKSLGARQVGEKIGIQWEVTVTYAKYEPLPWNSPPSYSFNFNSSEHIVDRDVEKGKAILNSAGCPYDPGVTAMRFEGVLSVQRNIFGWSIQQGITYTGAVNNDPFYGAPPGYCMAYITGSQQDVTIGDIVQRYWAVSYQFSFKTAEQWSPLNILDAGFTKKTKDGKLVPITIAGREPSTPVPLDGSGQPLGDGKDPVFNKIAVYKKLPFNALGV